MIETFVKISDTIDWRLDPHQFNPERMMIIEKIKTHSTWCKLKEITANVKQITTKLEINDIYVGLENIESHTGKYIQTNDKTSISSAAIFKKGDILFPKLRPYLNKIFLAEFNGKCSTEFHVFQAKKVNPEFLTIILRSNFVLSQTKHLMTGNTLPRLQTNDIRNLIIPLPPIEIQQKIVDIYNNANQIKQAKEQEAQELLNGIDDYLLKELGIELPENIENEKSFTVKVSDLIDKRLDPEYYNLTNQRLIKAIGKSSFPLEALSTITTLINNGRTPSSSDYSDIKTMYPIIKAGSYTNNTIDLSKVDFCKKKQSLKVEKDDIFILAAAHQAEYVGKQINLLEEQPKIETSYVGELLCIRTNDKCNPLFLFYILRTTIYKKLINREKRGQTSHIYPNDIRRIEIPLPPIDKQEEIAIYIQAIRKKAMQLQEDGSLLLEKTKKEIEKMIIE